MAKKLASLVQSADSDSHVPEEGHIKRDWEYWIGESATKVVVMEIHKEWCGPSAPMLAIFQRVYLQMDEPDNRIAFVSIHADQSEAVSKMNDIKEAASTCKPCFVILRNGAVVGRQDCINVPELQMYVNENLPAMPEDD